jgi:hypothetical protein
MRMRRDSRMTPMSLQAFKAAHANGTSTGHGQMNGPKTATPPAPSDATSGGGNEAMEHTAYHTQSAGNRFNQIVRAVKPRFIPDSEEEENRIPYAQMTVEQQINYDRRRVAQWIVRRIRRWVRVVYTVRVLLLLCLTVLVCGY